MVGYSEVYDQQYWDLCVRRLYLCGWVYGKGCTTYTEICDGFWDFAEDSQSSSLSWSVFILCIDFPMASTWGIFLGNLWVISRFNDLVLWAMFSCRWSSWNGEFWGKSSLWLHHIYIFKSDFVLMYAGIILIRSVFCWPALNMNNLMEILGSLLLSILTHPVQI